MAKYISDIVTLTESDASLSPVIFLLFASINPQREIVNGQRQFHKTKGKLSIAKNLKFSSSS